MIQVEGQYYLKFSFGAKDDFVTEEDLEVFSLIQEAGNILPTFELSITTSDEAILAELTEDKTVKITYGLNTGESSTAEMVVARVDTMPLAHSKRRVVISGLLNKLEYINGTRCQILPGKSGALLKKVLSKHFKVDGAQIS